MLYNLNNTNNQSAKSRKALLLVFLFVSSLFVSLVPAVSASHITQYAVQRDPSYISIGDLDCDGDNDIASASTMGLFITVLYNDGSGGFADRQDVFISNNDSRRAGFVDTADGTRVEVADIDGDGVNDLVYYQQNIRFVGESFVRPGNLTVLWGDCSERVNLWSDSEITVSNPFLSDMDVADIDGDGNADNVMVVRDNTLTNQYIQIYKGPDPTLLTAQQTLAVPLTNGLYTNMMLGHYGETVTGGGFPGGGGIGDCEDLDIWLLRTPPFNTGVGISVGHYDNMTVLEYDCLQGQYPNPMVAAPGVHEFKLDAEHNEPLYGIDIKDTDGNGEIDLIAAIDGLTGNISYAFGSGTSWSTRNYAYLGDFKGASITIEDVNNDGNYDFFVPTELTLTRTQDSSSQNQTFLLLENLREINSVEIILGKSDGSYLPSLSFDVGRRPTMAQPGQLQGGDDSAFEIVIGQRDYAYRFANNAMWLDTQGWPGAGDFLSVLSLDNEDVGITDVTVAPASFNPATGAAQLGEGNRYVNVTVKNTGLNPISGSIDVDLEVKEVLGGIDTIVYANDFDGNEDTSECSACNWVKYSYT